MELVTRLSEHIGSRDEKYYKSTLFQSEAFMLGINCLEPGQIQNPHEHADQTKFYYLVDGSGLFWLGEKRIRAKAGEVVWAPAGLSHGVENDGSDRLVLMVGIAPAP